MVFRKEEEVQHLPLSKFNDLPSCLNDKTGPQFTAAGTTRFQREKAETSLHRAYGSLCSVRGHDLPSRSARGL